MVSADTLRRAAALLRERAEAVRSHQRDMSMDLWFEADVDLRAAIRGQFKGNATSAPDDARWIALMHPGVGLALADWLDDELSNLEGLGVTWGANHPAVVLARLILGEES